MADSEEIASAVADLRQHVEWLRSTGQKFVLADRAAPRAKAEPPAPQRATPVVPPIGPPPVAATVEGRTLDEVRRELGDCKRCKLCQGRTNIVFGVGNPKAELVFVGEGPGADEDAQGIPFVGKAGQLLTKMIEAMGFARDEVYICNVVKCRPPGNRNPEPDEVAKCTPFLLQQIGLIQPKLIVAMGRFAAQTLLGTDASISSLRGRLHTYAGVPLIVTYHPAYLLRTLPDKAKAWEDLVFARKTMATL